MRLTTTTGIALTCAAALLVLPGTANAGGPTCFGRTPTITGSGYLEGTSGDDVVLAEPGAEVHTYGGDDRVCGAGLVHAGPGRDRIFYRGGGADILLDGGSGDDRIFYLGRALAEVEGHDGNDVLRTARGPQYVLGGRGNDDISTGRGKDYVNGGAGRDKINGGRGKDSGTGGGGKDLCGNLEDARSCER